MIEIIKSNVSDTTTDYELLKDLARKAESKIKTIGMPILNFGILFQMRGQTCRKRTERYASLPAFSFKSGG